MLIKQMKPLGFTLNEMRDLLDTFDAASVAEPGGEAVSGLAEELDREIAEVAARRADLARQLDAAHALEGSLRAVARDLLGSPVRVWGRDPPAHMAGTPRRSAPARRIIARWSSWSGKTSSRCLMNTPVTPGVATAASC